MLAGAATGRCELVHRGSMPIDIRFHDDFPAPDKRMIWARGSPDHVALLSRGWFSRWWLYWADRNGRWRLVPDLPPAASPGPLLAELDRDRAGAFWG